MKYYYHDKLILRTPFKPVKTSFSIDDLKLFFSESEVQEAIFLSSPIFFDRCKQWYKNELIDQEEERRVILSLLKYALRIHNRSTPFGLFAGCSVLEFENKNQKVILNQHTRNSRLDMNYTCSLAQELVKKTFIRPYVNFYPNNSLYVLYDKIRYVEYSYRNGTRLYQISSVDNSIYLQKIIQLAEDGATIQELAKAIVDEDVNIDEALNYIDELVTYQILVSELEPTVSGPELLNELIISLSKINNDHYSYELQNIIDVLSKIEEELKKLDDQIGNEISSYRNIANMVSQLNLNFDLNKLFQVDLFFDLSENKINQKVQYQLTKALKILNRLSEKIQISQLNEFKEKFINRYGEEEIPLLTVLDSESGIGYAQNNNHTGGGSPLIEGIVLNSSQNQNSKLSWGRKESFLLKKLIEATEKKQYSININIEEIANFEENWDDFPDSFSVVFNHVGNVNGQDKLIIDSIGGPSATILLGRFASNNLQIKDVIKDIAETEKKLNPDILLAEIVHLPQNRTGNVLLRPIFRDYEIPYISQSKLPKDQQINVSDLYLSIKEDNLFLRSKRLDKQVFPYLGNAHNFTHKSLPVYNFLCDMQFQNLKTGISFNWGSVSSEFTFLPRVEIDSVIVFLATWQFKNEEFHNLINNNNKSVLEEIKKIQIKWQIPNLVQLVEGDNTLVIDLNNELSIEMFILEIKNKQSFQLREYIFENQGVLVSDNKNNIYANEIIATLFKIQLNDFKSNHIELRGKESDFIKPQVNFSIGSNWLYYKLYCGTQIADKLLVDILKPLTEKLFHAKMIDKWFFIRYSDPDRHLRIRLHITEIKNIGEVIKLFRKAISDYEENNLVWKIQLDTYQREVFRYGANTIELAEKLFFIDSKYTLDLLEILNVTNSENIRWKIGIRLVDDLLFAFGFTLQDKLIFTEKFKKGFEMEFNMVRALKKQFDKKYRDFRVDISSMVDREMPLSGELKLFEATLSNKIKEQKHIFNELLLIKKKNNLHVEFDNLIASYIHMLLNRFFGNKQRLHEFMIYDFLWRTFRSQVAQMQQKKLVKSNKH